MTPPNLDAVAASVRRGDRSALARAITLVESSRADHEAQAQSLLQRLLPDTGRARRIGITGVPGAGKSTLIDALGMRLIAEGHKIAVLAVDPTSRRTGGSILGDKTRMARLAVETAAFIRPSPSGGALGGVARRTRETMLLCEAAGFDVVIVETVGVGQSETAVSEMVDSFLLIAVPGTGDELQGIKKGVLELADVIAVNKADGEGEPAARRAAGDLRGALNILGPVDPGWPVPVVLVSAKADTGLDTLWRELERHRAYLESSGALGEKRQRQQVNWMWSMVDDRLRHALRANPEVQRHLPSIEADVRDARLPPAAAAAELLRLMGL